MPYLTGTSQDPLRRVSWRGTLISSYAIKNVQVNNNLRDWLFWQFKKCIGECSWRVSEALVSRGLYHVGVIEAQLLDSMSLEFSSPMGCDLMLTCAARELREGRLGLDELEYYRRQMADRIQFELSSLLSQSIENYVRRTENPDLSVPTTPNPQKLTGLVDGTKFLTYQRQRPSRMFEIVRRSKLEA